MIVGSGSKVWQLLKLEIGSMFDIHVNGKDFDQFMMNISPHQTLYVANPPAEVLRKHIEKICELYPKTHLIFLSSLVVNVYDEASRYSYVSRKALQEQIVIDTCTKYGLEFCIVRAGPILSKKSSSKIFPFYTELNDLVSIILEDDKYSTEVIKEVFTLNDIVMRNMKIYEFSLYYMPFYFTRTVDFVLSRFGVSNYGYTFILNRMLRARR